MSRALALPLALLALSPARLLAQPAACTMPSARPSPAARKFVSPAVDALIASYLPRFLDANVGALFANTLPNTLDTTVFFHTAAPVADTFIVTGDIEASWQRDSTNQVWPYLRFLRNDSALATLVEGVVRRQTANVLRAPYANAFQLNSTRAGPHAGDATRPNMTANNWTFEGKWEVDSLANVLRLASGYYNATGDASPFDTVWLSAVRLILATFTTQQAGSVEEDDAGGAPYLFQRDTSEPSDSLEHGRGAVARRTGMIKTGFRGSDDATLLPFNIPENAFAAVALQGAAALLAALGYTADADVAAALAAEVRAGIAAYGTMRHPISQTTVYAYEVDGFGSAVFMDDANIPSLTALPLFGFALASDPLYQSTRAAVLSNVTNPYFMVGSAGEGVGGPHVGWPNIWPMAILARGLTATSDAEVAAQLDMLVASSACTGFMHESFNRNDVLLYTRPWFAWVNSLFGEFILTLADERPQLIFKS